jgi:hypothetical protein
VSDRTTDPCRYGLSYLFHVISRTGLPAAQPSYPVFLPIRLQCQLRSCRSSPLSKSIFPVGKILEKAAMNVKRDSLIHALHFDNGQYRYRVARQLPRGSQGRQSGPKYEVGAGRHSRRPVRDEAMNLREPIGTHVVALVLSATGAFAQDQKLDTSPIDPNAPLQPLNPSPSLR